MHLLSNESVLVRSNDDKIILTNLRVHMTSRKYGRNYQVTVFLEDISAIHNVYRSNTYYLFLAVLSFFWGAANSTSRENIPGIYAGIILGGIFLSLWLSTRGHQVTFFSRGGGSLSFFVDQMSDEQIEDFIHKVEEARLQRIKQL
jgi:hypothetical protein